MFDTSRETCHINSTLGENIMTNAQNIVINGTTVLTAVTTCDYCGGDLASGTHGTFKVRLTKAEAKAMKKAGRLTKYDIEKDRHGRYAFMTCAGVSVEVLIEARAR